MSGEGGGPPDPQQSACVLVGVRRYTALEPLPAVANNCRALQSALTDPRIWGLSDDDRCRTVLDPRTPDELIDPVIRAAKSARDTLVVYYAGHGVIDPHDLTLHLTLPGSQPEKPHTAVPYEWLRRAIIEHSRARRRIVVLDCCFSGRALGGMSEPPSLRAVASVEDTYLLTSAAENVRALSVPGEKFTAFTGELVDVLTNGVPEGPELLSLDDVYRQVRDSLAAKGRPEPQRQDRNEAGTRPLVRNQARLPARPEPPAPLWRRRRTALATGAAAVLFCPALVLWHAGANEEAAGDCSPHAALLAYSDDLDKSQHRGRDVRGLSALALTEGDRALALGDNTPVLLYEMALGGPRLAGLAIEDVTTLTDEDGAPHQGEQFDGEGLVDEGATVLVASESDAGPSLTRFRRSDGRAVASLPIPDNFRPSVNMESLTVTPDGGTLYLGLETPLVVDDTYRGQGMLRVQRYQGTRGGDYELAGQFGYQADAGLALVELVALGQGELLALERGYVAGVGNTVRVYHVSLAGLPDVSELTSLGAAPSDVFPADKRLVVDLGDCPASGATAQQEQLNPLLDNVESMALGEEIVDGEQRGRHVLYLLSDDNGATTQTTRVYAVAARLP
ncbi:caspase, EACC1-associated type [Streptomyces mayteni]